MSQRKAKEVRRALEQYDDVTGDVGYLLDKTAALERDIRTANRRQDDIQTSAKQRRCNIRAERKELHRWQRRVEITLVLLAAVMLVAGVTLLNIINQTSGKAAENHTKQTSVIQLAASAPAQQWSYSEEIPLPAEIQETLWAVSREFELPYELFLAMIERETDFRSILGDNGDSIGYMQVQPKHHKERMDRLGVTNLWDPASNFRVGADYLSEHLSNYGNIHLALMAYNCGPAGAQKLWRQGVYSSEYSKEIVARADYWRTVCNPPRGV